MKYTDISLRDLTIHISRVRRSRHYKVSIHDDGEIYATYPWYGSKKDLMAFLETKYDYIVESQKEIRLKVANQIERYDKEDLLVEKL